MALISHFFVAAFVPGLYGQPMIGQSGYGGTQSTSNSFATSNTNTFGQQNGYGGLGGLGGLGGGLGVNTGSSVGSSASSSASTSTTNNGMVKFHNINDEFEGN